MFARSCTRLLLLVVGQIALVRSRSAQLEAPGLEVGRRVHFRDRDRDSALLFSGVVPTELEQLV